MLKSPGVWGLKGGARFPPSTIVVINRIRIVIAVSSSSSSSYASITRSNNRSARIPERRMSKLTPRPP